jgi:hypothetical protein
MTTVHDKIADLSDGVIGAVEAIASSIKYIQQELPASLHHGAICLLLKGIEESGLRGSDIWDRFKECDQDPYAFMKSFETIAAQEKRMPTKTSAVLFFTTTP